MACMKYRFLIFFFLVVCSTLSQNKASDRDSIFIKVDKIPSFPGGDSALVKFMETNLKYPQQEKEAMIEGSCEIAFVVEKNGSVTNVKVAKELRGAPGCNREAIRLVTIMPKWEPGKQKNKTVRAQHSITVNFKLPVGFKITEKRVACQTVYIDTILVSAKRDSVFAKVDQLPFFPGGDSAMTKFMNDNLKYPELEREAGIYGNCRVVFFVEKDGSLSDIKILKGVPGGHGFNKEAMRLVNSMPKWEPAKQKHHVVRVQSTILITFKLPPRKPLNLQDRRYNDPHVITMPAH